MLGPNLQEADEVASQVQRSLFERHTDRTILQLIWRFMEEKKPEVGHLVDLRTGIGLMGSKPEFEMFVRVLLERNGFEVAPNRVLRGKCGRYEVDGIAKRRGVTYFVEIKHHFSYPELIYKQRMTTSLLRFLPLSFHFQLCIGSTTVSLPGFLGILRFLCRISSRDRGTSRYSLLRFPLESCSPHVDSCSKLRRLRR